MIRERRSSPLQRAPSSADVGIFALAWLLIALAPDVTTSNGVCKDLEGFDAFYVFVFGSAVVGGVAWERPAFAATRALRGW
jgi:hypothetical protein